MNLSDAELRNTALLLDVDGTLLDIAPTPVEVVVPGTLRETLAALAARLAGALALVSGRPLEDLDRTFAPLRLPAAGRHGAEVRTGPEDEPARAPDSSLAPDLRRRIAALARPGMLVEDKDSSIAIHYRQAPALGAPLLDAVTDLCASLPPGMVEILPGKAVVEVKRARFNKGTAVRQLLAHAPFRGRRPVYVGDDITDEAAFAVLPEFGGIGLSVGRPLYGAQPVFSAPGDVRRWLEGLVRQAEDVT